MKKTLTILTLALFLGTFLSSQSLYVVAQEDHHEAGDDDCDNATEFITVESHASEISFKTEEYTVSKNTCVQITFKNNNPIVAHDFTIDHFDGPHTDKIHMHLDNSTDGHMGMGMMTLNVTTPDADVTLEFICSVIGHEATMKGNLIVGEGSSDDSSLPSFEFYLAFTTILALATILARSRKK
ncbi:MAG: hypothetical protein ACW98K_11685 [Candidatus Kariarchaeaceae archaeon]|jgi:hypothetical protein